MEIPFLIKDESGNPVTNLVKADVVLKMASSPFTEMSYTDLGTIGASKGEYVLWGVNFYPTTCRLWIKGVVQDNWFGAQEVGEFSLKYALTGDITHIKSLTGNLQSAITNLESATGILSNRFASNAVLSANNTFTGLNTFSNTAVFDAGLSSNGLGVFTQGLFVYGGSLTSNFYHPVRFGNYIPMCTLVATRTNHLTNKQYVDSEITTRINTVGVGLTYQESENVIRLLPNGTTTGTCYATWSEAVTFANTNASSSRNITIQIPGNGTAGSIGMSLTAHDYVHFLGTGENIIIYPASQGFGASSIGKQYYENLTFYMDDSENPFSFTNIVFKNCKFIVVQSDGSPTFSGCKFEGGNIFEGLAVQFLNCIGERVLCSVEPTISGTNKLQYYTSSKLSIGTIGLTESGTTLQIDKNISVSGTTISTVAGTLNLGASTIVQGNLNVNTVGLSDDGGTLIIDKPVSIPSNLLLTGFGFTAPDKASDTISETYGLAQDGRACGTPDRWLDITIDGNVYAIPCYTPKA